MTGALLESLALKIGTSISNAILRRSVASTMEALRGEPTLETLLVRELPSPIKRHKLQRRFDAVAYEVAERLSGFWENEFSAVEDLEVQAAAEALATTFERGELDVARVLADDLNPLRLERTLRAADPDAAEAALLNESGTQIYDLALTEACNYVVEIWMLLPSTTPLLLREMLQRQTDLARDVADVLDRLPPKTSGLLGGTDAEVFELQYRRHLARRLDVLELFGVTLAPQHARYALSVAYIDLTVIDDRPDRPTSTAAKLRVEDALSHGRRHLVRGEAGSGKTTLLHWLAVRAARHDFGGRLKAWNGSVPFIVSLREFAEAALPTPEQLVGLVAPLLADEAPRGWARMHFDAGQALVLIDGVDELPPERRLEVHDWLTDLTGRFPKCRYIVTSRPSAVEEGWLAGEELEFSDLRILPLSIDETRRFIDHWHEAAAVDQDGETKAKLRRDAVALKATVSDGAPPHLVAFFQNPLLCAMLCALQQEHHGVLPQHRTELYRIALEALLDRRDRERKVPVADSGLQRDDKEQLLGGVAWWLVTNGRALVPRDVAQRIVEARLRRLPHATADADLALTELVARSGVLREPIAGHLDFVHKTFMEYFAAQEILADESVALLLDHASDAAWHETALMCAGLARGKSAERLLAGLVHLAEQPGASTELQVLLIGCMQAARDIDEAIGVRARNLIEAMIPPANERLARALAYRGDAIVPRLAYDASRSEAVAEACVTCLIEIGSPAALDTLASFTADDRPRVAKALVDGWPRFDPVVYAERALAARRLPGGRLELRDPVFLPAATKLRHLQALTCDFDEMSASDLEQLRALPATVTALRSRQLRDVRSLSALNTQPTLRQLHLGRSSALRTLWDDALPELNELELDAAGQLWLADGALARLAPGLDRLSVSGLANETSTFLAALDRLDRLRLEHMPIGELHAVARITGLEALLLRYLPLVTELPSLLSLDRLRTLDLTACGRLANLETTLLPESLESLRLDGTAINRLGPLEHMPRLTRVDLARSIAITDVATLSEAKALERVCLDSTAVHSIAPLGKVETLIEVSLYDTPVVDLAPLAASEGLRRLSLRNAGRVQDLRPLARLAQIEELDISGCWRYVDTEPLRALAKLRSLTLDSHAIAQPQTVQVLTDLPALQRVAIRSVGVHSGGKYDVTSLVDRGIVVVPDDGTSVLAL